MILNIMINCEVVFTPRFIAVIVASLTKLGARGRNPYIYIYIYIYMYTYHIHRYTHTARREGEQVLSEDL